MYDSLIITLLAIPFAFWLALALALHGRSFNMDSPAPGAFFGIFSIYRTIAFTSFYISLAITIVSGWKGWPPSAYINIAAAITSFLFVVWVTYCYEGYLHADELRKRLIRPENESYKGWKYGLTLSLGICGTGYFITGLITFLMTIMGR